MTRTMSIWIRNKEIETFRKLVNRMIHQTAKGSPENELAKKMSGVMSPEKKEVKRGK